jgi:Holliday junction resolvasome RuvABC endonuclease subunit
MAANPEDVKKRNVRNNPVLWQKERNEFNIAGLDLSLKGTSFCAFDLAQKDKKQIPGVSFEEPCLMYVTTIDTTKMLGINRMLYIEDTIKDLLKQHAIDLAFIENFSFGSKGRAIFDTGGLGWIIRRLFVRECKIPYHLIAPKTLKMFVTGNGNAGKPLMLEQTYRRWKVGSEVLQDDNQVDSFGLCKIGQAYLEWQEGKNDFTKKQLQALKAIE